MNEDRVRYGVIALEMTSVVVAIIFGFAVSNWDASRAEERRAAVATDRMMLELEANLESIYTVVPYYDSILGSIIEVLEDQGDRRLVLPPVQGWRGITPPALRTSAFEVASSTGSLGHVPFETADQLTTAYAAIEDLQTGIAQTTTAYLSNAPNMRLSDLRIFLGVLAERMVVTAEVIREVRRALAEAGA